jgi:WD40 repeat protein
MSHVGGETITRRELMRAAGAAALGATVLRSPAGAQAPVPTLSPVAKFEPAGGYFVNGGMTLAPDGKSMLTVCAGDDATVWDLAKTKPIATFPATDVLGAQFVGDGKRAITFDKKQVSLWTIGNTRAVRTLTPGGDEPIEAVAVAPDGHSLVIGQSLTMSLWNLDTGARIKTRGEAEKSYILHLTFSPDGTRLACVNQGWLRLYDMPALVSLADRSLGDFMGRAAFSPDSRRVFVGEKEQVTVIDVASKAEVARIAGPTQSLFLPVAVFRDGNRFLAGDYWSDGRCWFGNLTKGSFVAQTGPLSVTHAAVTPDQRYAYVCGGGTIYTFDVAGVS